ncbi:unnamed protein product [Allacma fusca]|uniref:Uncharacterized protein n=1 Tax=Allacma fusca TaxID=39272 RepID=A0A8J2JUX9_9HEXA|nr:unnamed protein product [Allacma fusca]
MPKVMEPFLPEGDSCNDRTIGLRTSSTIIRRESKLACNAWGSRMTRKLLKLQLICIVALIWIGIAIYGCDFPIKVFLNQILISLYFAIIYTFGLTVGYYALYTLSVVGIRVASLLQLITITASCLFGYLCFQSLAEHADKDRNPLTRLWAANMYSAVILLNGLIMATALGITYQGFASTCKMPRRKRRGLESQGPKNAVSPVETELEVV